MDISGLPTLGFIWKLCFHLYLGFHKQANFPGVMLVISGTLYENLCLLKPYLISLYPFHWFAGSGRHGLHQYLKYEMRHIGLCDIEKTVEEIRLFFNPHFPSCCSSGYNLQNLGSLEAEAQVLLLKIRLA